MPKSAHAPGAMVPVAAVQPITGGMAPVMAPTSVFTVVRGLSGV